ncbi:uncharacterized protein LOC130760080 [Actinidia eriantha]|uniref:uncharacterized protein LOC130760080 n=1 Tax=Actinidia eriantha TaxID=165200 RepID=UPI002585067D|nr:uncharacterized protein LOC130760080 [Actinidia eriantha]
MVEAQDTQGASGKILCSKLINFKLPEDCVDCILRLDEEVKATHGGDCLSLLERLEGWIIEKIRRDNTGKYDNYFYHIKSGGRFRSFIEVVTFIIHCTFPKRRTTTKDGNIISEKKRQETEKFLEEAWRNLSNDQHPTRTTKDINIISEKKRQFEKMLEEAWKNLSNNQQQHTSVEDVLTPEPRVGEHS